MRFESPAFLFLILVLAGVFYMLEFYRKGAAKAVINFPGGAVAKDGKSLKIKLSQYLKYLRYIVLVLIIIAVARPQTGQITEDVHNQGIDIILTIDTSGTMRALDFAPLTRMDLARRFAINFTRARRFDRIGVVVYSAEAFTLVPVTSDRNTVLNMLATVEDGMTRIDGTALGSAILTSVNRLIDSPARSRLIILITDGENNMGEVDPITAAHIAASEGIKIYTIGVGKHGDPLFEIIGEDGRRTLVHVEDAGIDEETLIEIADITGGEFFRVLDQRGFERAMRQIDAMERTDVRDIIFSEFNERYGIFLWAAFILLLLEILLSNTFLRRLP
ncbi:MAG: VWA domain-containing protein [Elusimicrobia bacterium]|nr:VWA domain-containing protein [Elusimicrobiota bacterium]